MLKLFGCEGYRAFQSSTEVELGQLTVIFGKNNSGKTTLTRLPLFIESALGRPEHYSLTNGELRFGATFRDLSNFAQPHPAVTYWTESDDGAHWRVRLQSVTTALDESVHLTSLSTSAGDFNFPLSDTPSDRQLAIVSSHDATSIEQGRRDIGKSVHGLLHIPSARPDIHRIYEARSAEGATVHEAPYWLYQDRSLLQEVNEWLVSNLDGLSVGVEHTDYGFRLVTGQSTRPVNFASAGRGSQALLPVVTLLKAVSLGHVTPPLVVIEEPEAHLHPSAHGAVAELVAEASRRTQVLTETHSENFILRLRRKVASKEMRHNDLRLVFVDVEQTTINIKVDENGGVDMWPEGVFEYDVEEARGIVEARLKALRAES